MGHHLPLTGEVGREVTAKAEAGEDGRETGSLPPLTIGEVGKESKQYLLWIDGMGWGREGDKGLSCLPLIPSAMCRIQSL